RTPSDRAFDGRAWAEPRIDVLDYLAAGNIDRGGVRLARGAAPPLERVVALGSAANGELDCVLAREQPVQRERASLAGWQDDAEPAVGEHAVEVDADAAQLLPGLGPHGSRQLAARFELGVDAGHVLPCPHPQVGGLIGKEQRVDAAVPLRQPVARFEPQPKLANCTT